MDDNKFIPFEEWIKKTNFKPTQWQDMLLGEWSDSAAYSREEVEVMVSRGEISAQRGEELLHYRIGIDSGTGNDVGVSQHLLTAKDGSKALCGGPGVCKWCDRGAAHG